MAAKEQKVNVSVNDAQKVIDTVFAMYPGLVPFFDECKARARDERWMCHCFGRFRRFPQSHDPTLIGEFERQAMNFPIQGMIASAMSRAIAYLYDYKKQRDPNMFRILLQVHDALLLEVPYENVITVTQEVLPLVMRDMIPIYPTNLAGESNGTGPFNLGVESEVMGHWGEQLTEDQAFKIGLTQPYWSEAGMSVHYFEPNKKE